MLLTYFLNDFEMVPVIIIIIIIIIVVVVVTSPIPTEREAGWAPYRVWTILEQRQTYFNHLHSKPAPYYDNFHSNRNFFLGQH